MTSEIWLALIFGLLLGAFLSSNIPRVHDFFNSAKFFEGLNKGLWIGYKIRGGGDKKTKVKNRVQDRNKPPSEEDIKWLEKNKFKKTAGEARRQVEEGKKEVKK